jgi:hypothetical protein
MSYLPLHLMTLQEFIDNSPKREQFKYAIWLTKSCLPIWNSYAEKNELSYRDSVVGLHHNVDSQLLKDSIDTTEVFTNLNIIEKLIDGKRKLIKLRRQFDDPIVALQDLDWELPNTVQQTFYSVYNLLEALLGVTKTVFDQSTIYVSISQATDAITTDGLMTLEDIKSHLTAIRNGR